MPLDIRVNNLQEFINAYDGAQHVIEEEIDDAVSGVLGQAVQDAAIYPAPLPTSNYTYNLQQGWLSQDARFVIGGGGRIDSVLSNPVPYGGYVQDADMQMASAKGRWTTIQDIAAKYEPIVQDALLSAFEAAQDRIEEA
jgi:hypothetical protein